MEVTVTEQILRDLGVIERIEDIEDEAVFLRFRSYEKICKYLSELLERNITRTTRTEISEGGDGVCFNSKTLHDIVTIVGPSNVLFEQQPFKAAIEAGEVINIGRTGCLTRLMLDTKHINALALAKAVTLLPLIETFIIHNRYLITEFTSGYEHELL